MKLLHGQSNGVEIPKTSLTSTVEVVVMKGTLGDADVRIMLVVA